jgi:excisionase family DNA binding protein
MIKLTTREVSMLDAQQKRYVTVAEAAKRLHVSHPTVWRWIRAGKLAAYRVGPKTIRVDEAELATLVQPVGRPREEVNAVRGSLSMQTSIDTSPLTEDEQQRGLAALAELDALQERMLASRGGQPFPSSVDLIQQLRDERSEHLDSL